MLKTIYIVIYTISKFDDMSQIIFFHVFVSVMNMNELNYKEVKTLL